MNRKDKSHPVDYGASQGRDQNLMQFDAGIEYGDRADSQDIRDALWQQEQRAGGKRSHSNNEQEEDGEEFEPDMNEEVLDLSGQGIDDLMPLIELVFMKMPFLRELNLSNNLIDSLPRELCSKYLPCLEQINLNNNQIAQDQTAFAEVVDSLALIGQPTNQNQQSSGGLKALFINLTREEQVDFILRKLPKLEFLNGLAVDREELYSSQDGDNSPVQVNETNNSEEVKVNQSFNSATQHISPQINENDLNQNTGSDDQEQESQEDIEGSGAVPEHRAKPEETGWVGNQQEDESPQEAQVSMPDKREQEQEYMGGDSMELIDANAEQRPLQTSSHQKEVPQPIQFDQNQYGSFAAANPPEHEDTEESGPRESPTLNQHTSQAEGQTSEKEQPTEEDDIELFDINLLEEALESTQKKTNPNGVDQSEAPEGINADEFEHIAEIYDQIRLLYQQFLFSDRSSQSLKTQIDRNLASYFDTKLKLVMEELAMSQSVGSPEPNQSPGENAQLSQSLKREKSQWSVYQLYMVCAEKIMSLSLKENQDIANVNVQVFRGLAKIVKRYQKLVIDLDTKNQRLGNELQRNQIETQQVLEAAEHLEQNNASNIEKANKLEQQNQELLQRVKVLEEENQRQKKAIQSMQMMQQQPRLESSKQALQHQFNKQHRSQQQSLSLQSQAQGQGQGQNPNTLRQQMSEASAGSEKQINVQRPASSLGIPQRDTHQQPGPQQNFNNPSMSARGLPLAPPGFQKQSTGNLSQRSHTPTQMNTKRSQPGKLFGKGASAITQVSSSAQKTLTLKQLKDLITDIYAQKTKFDQKCEENRLPRETMEQYMYTYLNQRYGLKNLIIEWASSIISGIKMFQKEDHDVALFGKILRSECDEEFRFIQQTVRETVIALLRALFREKFPTKPENTLIGLVDNVLSGKGFVETWQWKKIIEKMYDEEDYRLLEQQLLQKLHSQTPRGQQQNTGRGRSSSNNLTPTSRDGKRPLTRSQLNQRQAEDSQSKLKFNVFLKCVLDFQLREHEKFLAYFTAQFKRVDTDRDGVLDESQFRDLMHNIGFNQDYAQSFSADFQPKRIETFLQTIDPYSNQKITFSECVHLLSSEMVLVPNTITPQSFHPSEVSSSGYDQQEMVQVAILEHLSQNLSGIGLQGHNSEASTPSMSNRN